MQLGVGYKGAGTTIRQSFAKYHNYGNVAVDIGSASVSNAYKVYIPSGCSIQSYLRLVAANGSAGGGTAGGGSPICLSPTGTFFEISIS